jgi:hypothetical protein
MQKFTRADRDSVSPGQAAERLTDIAFALATGGPLEVTVDHERLSVPLGDEVVIRRHLASDGDHVKLDVRLSWSQKADGG